MGIFQATLLHHERSPLLSGDKIQSMRNEITWACEQVGQTSTTPKLVTGFASDSLALAVQICGGGITPNPYDQPGPSADPHVKHRLLKQLGFGCIHILLYSVG
jgi:hypothetical protein